MFAGHILYTSSMYWEEEVQTYSSFNILQDIKGNKTYTQKTKIQIRIWSVP